MLERQNMVFTQCDINLLFTEIDCKITLKELTLLLPDKPKLALCYTTILTRKNIKKKKRKLKKNMLNNA